MRIVATHWALHICQCHLAIKSLWAILSSCVRIWDTCSLICGIVTQFASISLKFRCTGASTAYVLCHVVPDSAYHISQSHLAMRQYMWYWVFGSAYETQLAYPGQSCSICCHMIEVNVQHWVLGTYHYDQSITAYLPLPVAIMTV